MIKARHLLVPNLMSDCSETAFFTPLIAKTVKTEANIPVAFWQGLEFVDPKSCCAGESGVWDLLTASEKPDRLPGKTGGKALWVSVIRKGENSRWGCNRWGVNSGGFSFPKEGKDRLPCGGLRYWGPSSSSTRKVDSDPLFPFRSLPPSQAAWTESKVNCLEIYLNLHLYPKEEGKVQDPVRKSSAIRWGKKSLWSDCCSQKAFSGYLARTTEADWKSGIREELGDRLLLLGPSWEDPCPQAWFPDHCNPHRTSMTTPALSSPQEKHIPMRTDYPLPSRWKREPILLLFDPNFCLVFPITGSRVG